MFSALPKLLDRNFAIGYLLPCILFVLASYQILRRLSDHNWFLHFAPSDVTTRTTTFLVIAGVVAVFLALGNTFLIRRLEGYGWPFTKLPALIEYQRRRYRQIAHKISDYDDNWDDFLASGGAKLAAARKDRDEPQRTLVVTFPDHENAILPTSIGNIIRAFEVYPRVMYGLDSIPGWPRLLGVVPESYLKYAQDAKAKLDFCVNCFYLSAMLIVIIAISMASPRHVGWLITWFLADLIVMGLLWQMVKQAAIAWGNFIKSCFDLYIDELGIQLGYNAPLSKETWTNITQAFLYPDDFPPKPRRSQLGKK